jgi:large subunit ribosomal protein L21
VAYAIIRSGGKQFRVSPGDVLRVPSIADKTAGDAVEFDVLTTGGDDGVRIGSPIVDGTSVSGTVVKHGRAPKIIVFKFKRRKGYKKTKGHRQGFTEILIGTIGDRQAEPDPSVLNDEAVEATAAPEAEITETATEPESEN